MVRNKRITQINIPLDPQSSQFVTATEHCEILEAGSPVYGTQSMLPMVADDFTEALLAQLNTKLAVLGLVIGKGA